MSSPSTVKAYSLKVPKSFGEKAIRLATKLGLMSRDLKVLSVDEYICVPLDHSPTPSHVAEFNKAFPQFDIHVQDFYKRVKSSQDALEIAGDRLPPHLLASFPRAIDFVGDVAVVEVPPELQGHKKLIGEAILEAHKHVRTVLAKSSAVSGEHRLRKYEVIAGSSNTETVHREHGCKFHLDLRKVYFSPRLSHEHHRVASQVKEKETVIDMFVGVGPFSILTAKMHSEVKVYAIDVNPAAARYLERNVVSNGVLEKVIPILGDAKEVIHSRLQGTADRVIMNLPERAIEYLGSACEAAKPEGGIIHYYEFAKGPDSVEVAKERVTEALEQKGRRVEELLSARNVREVAPFKWQVAVDVLVR